MFNAKKRGQKHKQRQRARKRSDESGDDSGEENVEINRLSRKERLNPNKQTSKKVKFFFEISCCEFWTFFLTFQFLNFFFKY